MCMLLDREPVDRVARLNADCAVRHGVECFVKWNVLKLADVDNSNN